MRRRLIETDGLRQSVLEAGSGPLVILCHGFPELAWSWRAQVEALAAAGFHAVAPDMRGYGETERPDGADAYTILHLVGDMVDLVRALGADEAAIVGHDWGAPVAWHAALLRPDLFRAVAGLSVPFHPWRAGIPPVAAWRAVAAAKGLGEFYMTAFQAPGAEAPLEADVEGALTKVFWSYDGATPAAERSTGFFPEGETLLGSISDAARRPPWMSEADLAVYVRAFEATGFSGPFAWYRNLDRNRELTAFTAGRRIEVPALFMVGEHDPVRLYAGRAEAELAAWCTDLRGAHVIPGAGHWVQQERSQVINDLLSSYLRGL